MAYILSQLNVVTAGSGPPLVLIHGNPATHTLWRPLMKPLSQHYTIYAVDLPGYGSSPLPASLQDMSRERIAHILLDWVEQQHLERFDLIGHSFGGSIAATMADMQPERIRSLTLITPLGDNPPPAGMAAASPITHVVRPLWQITPAPLRRWIIRRGSRLSYGSAYSRDRAVEVSHEVGRRHMIYSMTEVMRRINYPAYHDTLVRLNAQHRMPLLLVGAGRDNIIPYSHFQRTRTLLGRAECHLFPDGGHVPMWQYPDELAGILTAFYQRVTQEDTGHEC